MLDLDETLLDFTRAERENLISVFTRRGLPADEAVLQRFHTINDGLWKTLERGGITRERLKEERFARLFGEYGVEEDVPAVAKEYYENFLRFCFPFEGAAEFLKALGGRGRRFIVTNGGSLIQRGHIRDAGFEDELEGVFISEEMGVDKPSVQFVEAVERSIADYDRSRAVWMGDSLTSDKLCAESKGIDFVLFVPEGKEDGGYRGAVARSYGEALRIFGSM